MFLGLSLLSLVNLDEGLVSVNPMSVVGTSAWLALDDDNLLSGLAAGLDDWLELSDLSLVNLNLFVQVSVHSNSGSILSSVQMSSLLLCARNSKLEDFNLSRAGLLNSLFEFDNSSVGLDDSLVQNGLSVCELDFLVEDSDVSLLNSDLVVDRLTSRSVQVLSGADGLSSLELDDGDLGNSISGDVVSSRKDSDLLGILSDNSCPSLDSVGGA